MKMKHLGSLLTTLLLINLSCKKEEAVRPPVPRRQTLTFTTPNAIQVGSKVKAEAKANTNYNGIITYTLEKIAGDDLEVNLSSSNRITALKGEGRIILTATAPADENYLEAKEKLEIIIAKKVIPEELYIKGKANFKIGDKVLTSNLFGFIGHSSRIKLSVKNSDDYPYERAYVIGNEVTIEHAGGIIITATSTGGYDRVPAYKNGVSTYDDVLYSSAYKMHSIQVAKKPTAVKFPATNNMKLYANSPNKRICARLQEGNGQIRYRISWVNRPGIASIDSTTGELRLYDSGQIRVKATVAATNDYEEASAETEIITIEK